MKMTSDLHVVGGGYFGFGLSGYLDCHVFVLNSGSELALIDPGMGMDRDFDTILDNIRDDGLGSRQDPQADPDALSLSITSALPPKRKSALMSKSTHRILRRRSSATPTRKRSRLMSPKRRISIPQTFSCRPARWMWNWWKVMWSRSAIWSWRHLETPGHCDGHLSFLMRGGRPNQIELLASAPIWFSGAGQPNLSSGRTSMTAASTPMPTACSRWSPTTSMP